MSASIGLPQFSHLNVSTFKTHLDAVLTNNLAQIECLLDENTHYTWSNLMYPLDDLADAVEKLWSPLSHLHAVKDSLALRACYNDCLPLLSAYETAIGHNKRLYEALKTIPIQDLNAAQRHILQDNIRGFELAGVALPQEKKNRFEAIQARLAELSNQFEHHILDATQAFTLHVTEQARLEGLPPYALEAAKELAEDKELDGYLFTLEYPSFHAIMTYAADQSLREAMYHAYVTRASDEGPHAGLYDNSTLMNEILALRHEKAQLLGFANYAELSVETKMAQSPQQVLTFLLDLVARAKAQAQEEFSQLSAFAQQQLSMTKLNPWDVAYSTEQRRQALFSLSQEELRPYFPQPKVMQGMFAIINALYGVRLEELTAVDVWHADVQCYAVVDEHNQVRGYVYTDLYSRPHKQGGAWMNSMQSRRRFEDGTIQLPIATLTCNFARPTGGKPALLSHDELTTLFHEMGHCLHHLLTQVDYLDASGIHGVEWDAVELPSQFFENWCWEKQALTLLTEHVETQEPLPDILFQRLIQAKNFQSAMAMMRQAEFSLFDFRLHQEFQADESFISHVLADVRRQTNIIPLAPYNRFQHSFSHIFAGGYAAGYYSYSFAEVLSSDAFSRFEEEGIFNTKTGHDFLHSILEVGGSKPAAEAFSAFRGREATIDAFLRHNGIH
ncbi:MAG: oligopeptidase A [Legionella sp.]|nr:MAG: oligopeptidase A [Legionella sp.]PJE00196.1 MAG: oligopeptidase A [Legionella sp.]